MIPGLTQETTEERPRICAASGLELHASRGGRTYRVAQAKYGPLNPQPRPEERPRANIDAWKAWQRWDVPGRRTVYAASTKRVAYAEVLGSFKRHLADNPGSGLDLSKYLDNIADSSSGWAAVNSEWGNTMAPYSLPASWRDSRLMFCLTLPRSGWFVDITRMESMSAVTKALGPQLALMGVSEVDLSLLTSGRRDVTCQISEWVHSLTLDDGSVAHGIVFPSRHGDDRCWATWLRKLDDGLAPESEPTKPDTGSAIHRNDPDLNFVLKLFGLTIF